MYTYFAVRLLTYNVPAGSKVGIEISSSDVATLDTGEYLNDIVVDFYLRSVIVLLYS